VADAADLAAAGFFACVADLEEELIRAVGTAGVEEVVVEHPEHHARAPVERLLPTAVPAPLRALLAST
jgi:hypothetical protein